MECWEIIYKGLTVKIPVCLNRIENWNNFFLKRTKQFQDRKGFIWMGLTYSYTDRGRIIRKVCSIRALIGRSKIRAEQENLVCG